MADENCLESSNPEHDWIPAFVPSWVNFPTGSYARHSSEFRPAHFGCKGHSTPANGTKQTKNIPQTTNKNSPKQNLSFADLQGHRADR